MINVPAHVSKAIFYLQNGGYQAYIVGGAVRDSILGLEPKDWDISTNATPEEVKPLFKTVHPIGEKHGTVVAVIDGKEVEITTFRNDGFYANGRRPLSVDFVSDLTEDLSRRDFTFNAMAYNPATKVIIDPFDGIVDLKKETVRAVGEAKDRLIEDPLRMMRAIRFACQLNFKLSPEVCIAIEEYSYMLSLVSTERIRMELEKILMSNHPGDGLRMMLRYNVLHQVLPRHVLLASVDQTYPHVCDALTHTFQVVDLLAGESLDLLLAGLFHDIGKYYTKTVDELGFVHFYGHEIVSAQLAKSEMQRLKFSNHMIDKVCLLVKEHMFDEGMKKNGIKRLLGRLSPSKRDFSLIHKLIKLRLADVSSMYRSFSLKKCVEIEKFTERVNKLEQGEEVIYVSELAINGYDIKDVFRVEGKAVGNALLFAMEAVFEKKVANDKDTILNFLKSNELKWKFK